MTVVHVHIERTAGVSLQNLYEQQYSGQEMLWYSARDTMFAPFDIKTANYTKNWQLKAYAFAARHLPSVRRRIVAERTRQRELQQVSLPEIPRIAKVVIGHFAVSDVIDVLPPDEHEYRTVIRDPLARMISHFHYWHAHRGDVGHRVVPDYSPAMTFEEFALLPELQNYQTQAIGDDPSIFKHIGITNKLGDFAVVVGLAKNAQDVPAVNHFTGESQDLKPEFVKKFRKLHSRDIALYAHLSENP